MPYNHLMTKTKISSAYFIARKSKIFNMLTKFNLILVACPGFQSRPLLAPTPGIFSPEPAPAPADNYFDFFTTVTKFLKKLFIQYC